MPFLVKPKAGLFVVNGFGGVKGNAFFKAKIAGENIAVSVKSNASVIAVGGSDKRKGAKVICSQSGLAGNTGRVGGIKFSPVLG